MLPVKKIYIDTKKKTSDSVSNSNFKYEIPETIALPHNTVFFIDDICIPHTWYTIETNVNDRVYIQFADRTLSSSSPAGICKIVQLDAGNYNLQTLATEITHKANTAFAPATTPFYVTPNQNSNTLFLSGPYYIESVLQA